jgi:hypothetical protein
VLEDQIEALVVLQPSTGCASQKQETQTAHLLFPTKFSFTSISAPFLTLFDKCHL